MSRDIPGVIDGAALAALFGHDKPATVNAPSDRHGYRKAARDMIARGYSTRDTAHALRLTVPGVLELLSESEPQDSKLRRWQR